MSSDRIRNEQVRPIRVPNVTIHSDHRPLEAIMRKSRIAAPKRTQAMMLTIQRYAFTVK